MYDFVERLGHETSRLGNVGQNTIVLKAPLCKIIYTPLFPFTLYYLFTSTNYQLSHIKLVLSKLI